MNKLAKYLEVPDEYLDEFEELGIELQTNTGSSGGMDYNYYFYVPKETPKGLLKAMDWSTGQCIDDIPIWLLDDEDSTGVDE